MISHKHKGDNQFQITHLLQILEYDILSTIVSYNQYRQTLRRNTYDGLNQNALLLSRHVYFLARDFHWSFGCRFAANESVGRSNRGSSLSLSQSSFGAHACALGNGSNQRRLVVGDASTETPLLYWHNRLQSTVGEHSWR
jgi:hypothetical protein